MIDIRQLDDTTFEVTVVDTSTTRHRVTLKADYYQSLTGGKIPPAELIRASFAFLLEREPNTSILSHFELGVIGRYFPEYEDEIRSRLSG